MIGFLHPWALLGLTAAAIPILLHLLSRREPPTVAFPAVRYLVAATREHQRRLRLRNLLLLALRTALVVLLVLAAAAPTAALRGVPGHAPSALVLVLDNSPSSGAVIGGAPRYQALRAAARRIVARAAPADALWLLTADGIPRRGDATALAALLDSLPIGSRRLDLGRAISTADEVLATDSRPGEIVVVSDLQTSALSPARVRRPLAIVRPTDPSPPNAAIVRLDAGAQPWSTTGGRVAVAVAGDSGPPIPLDVRLGERQSRQALVARNGAGTVALAGASGGWWPLTAELEADELRADDRRSAVVRVAPVARIRCDSTGRYVAAACSVLLGNRRATVGDEVTLGRLARGRSIVQPPADAAAVGALNRALAARGVKWSYGALSLGAATTDSGALIGRHRISRRYQLVPAGSGRSGVLATAAGAPWLVRDGDVVLLGSRLDSAWTDLPLSAEFMPFVDLLVNRVARGELALVSAAPGEPVALPDAVTEVRREGRDWRVEGGAAFRAPKPGIYFLVAGHDTTGALAVNLDPRESRLAVASDESVRRLWPGARLLGLADASRAAFAAGGRGDLRAPLLWAALLTGLGEVAIASAWRRTR